MHIKRLCKCMMVSRAGRFYIVACSHTRASPQTEGSPLQRHFSLREKSVSIAGSLCDRLPVERMQHDCTVCFLQHSSTSSFSEQEAARLDRSIGDSYSCASGDGRNCR